MSHSTHQFPITTLFALAPPHPLSHTLPYLAHFSNTTIKKLILDANIDAMVRNKYESETVLQDALDEALRAEIQQIQRQIVENMPASRKQQLPKDQNNQPYLPTPSTHEIIYSLYQLLKSATRLRMPYQDFQQDLNALIEDAYSAKERRMLKLRDGGASYDKEVFRVARLLGAYYKKRREALIDALRETPRKTHDSLDEFRWRVDVTISNSMMNKVFTPVIWMKMKLDNGREEVFEVSLEKFHQLRLETAEVIQQMNEIQSHPMMNIQEK